MKVKKLLTLFKVFGTVATLPLFFCASARASEYPYVWVKHKGQRVKQWTISNEKYTYLAPPASIKKSAPPIANNQESSKAVVSLGYGFSALNITDKTNQAEGSIYSDGKLSVDVLWEFSAKNFSYFTQTRFDKISYNEGSSTIDNLELDLLSLRSGLSFGEVYKTYAFIQYGQYPFVSVKNQKFSIEKLALPSIGFQLKKDLYTGRTWSLGLELEGQYIWGGKSDFVEADSGHITSLSIVTVKKNKSFDYYLSTGAQRRSQDTSVVKQNQTDINATIGFLFDF